MESESVSSRSRLEMSSRLSGRIFLREAVFSYAADCHFASPTNLLLKALSFTGASGQKSPPEIAVSMVGVNSRLSSFAFGSTNGNNISLPDEACRANLGSRGPLEGLSTHQVPIQQNVLRRGYLAEIAELAITIAFARRPSRIAIHLPRLFNIR